METSPVTTSAPAASAPPATSAPAPAAPSSTPSTPTREGGIKPSYARDVFDSFDAADAGGPDAGADAAPQDIPIAQTPDVAAAAPDLTPTEGLEGQEALSPRLAGIREALKNTALDPKLQRHLTDAAFIMQDLSRAGTPLPVLKQFIADAPKYLAVAPSVEVLETMAETAQTARAIHEGFTSNTPEGFQQFTGALLQGNPQAVIGWMGWMLGQTDGLVSGLRQHFGQEASDTFVGHLDSFVDQRVSNGIARMRQDALKGEDFAVLAEVADEMEKYFGLAPDAQKARQQSKPDPRDLKIQQLEGERKQQQAARVEGFRDNVFNRAGSALDGDLKAYLAKRCAGLPPKLSDRIYKEIGGEQGALYRELLSNPHIKARAAAIEQSGRYDKDTFQKLTDFYIGQGKRLMENVSASIIREYSEFAIPADAVRRQRLEATVNRRDPGASGAPALNRQPANAGRPAPTRTAAQSVFDELDRQADSAR